MTEQELEAMENRAGAATPGPWTVDVDDCEVWSRAGLIAGMAPVKVDVRNPDADAIFIAHARTDVPALVAEVRRLRAEFGSCDACGSRWDDDDGHHTPACPKAKK